MLRTQTLRHASQWQSRRGLSSALRPLEPNGLSIYVHWPYCAKICPYCDFNRYLNDSVDHKLMKSSFLAELSYFLELRKEAFGSPPKITSIFFGGGTPSLAKPDTFRAIIDLARDVAVLDPNTEITMEANPSSVETEKLKDFKAAGINRLSLGIQALNEEDLKFLGRAHNLKEALAALELSAKLFDRRSFDLIYARHPGQTLQDWRKEVKLALQFGTGHLSMYSLTIEPGTPFHRRVHSGKLQLVDEDAQAALYDVAVEEASKGGYEQYEVSNFAKAGHESRHNLNYWLGGDYIGIGPGASGRLFLKNGTRESFLGKKHPQRWAEGVMTRSPTGLIDSCQEHRVLTAKEQTYELLLSGLRIKDGVLRSTFGKFSAEQSIEDFCNKGSLKKWQLTKKLVLDEHGIRLSNEGRKILDTILLDVI